MKKVITMLLVLAMALSLCACSSSEYEKYAKYADLFEALEEEDYKAAVAMIIEMANEGTSDGGKTDDGKDEGVKEEEEPKYATEEERELLWEYAELCSELQDYADGNYASVKDEESGEYLEGSEMLAYIYKRLQEIDSVDHWIAEGEHTYDDSPRDRQKVLDGFAILEDVLYKSPFSRLDHMGNVSDDYAPNSWTYDETGRLVKYYNNRSNYEDKWADRFCDYGSYYYEYDEAGRVTKISRKSGDTVEAIYTPTYDAAGNEVSCTVKTNSGERVEYYEYDAAGNMIKATRVFDGYTYITEYAYDASGKVLEMKGTEYYKYGTDDQRLNTQWTVAYVYEGGVLKSRTETKDTYTYTWVGNVREFYIAYQTVNTVEVECDAQGRVVKEVLAYGDTVNMSNGEKTRPNSVSRTIEYIYGDYYLYTPAE